MGINLRPLEIAKYAFFCIIFSTINSCSTPTTEPTDNQDSFHVVYSWRPPTSGSPVSYYVGQWEKGGTWGEPFLCGPDTLWSQDIQIGSIYRFRVSGVDSIGRQGEWSLPSRYLVLSKDDEHLDQDPHRESL